MQLRYTSASQSWASYAGRSIIQKSVRKTRVHRGSLRLEPGALEQLAHAGGDHSVKLAGVRNHFALGRFGRRAVRTQLVGRAAVAVAIDALSFPG